MEIIIQTDGRQYKCRKSDICLACQIRFICWGTKDRFVRVMGSYTIETLADYLWGDRAKIKNKKMKVMPGTIRGVSVKVK